MTRILAVADEVERGLYGDTLHRLRPDLIVSCGDLPFEYLENLVTRAGVPLVYVPGNHDPDLTRSADPAGAWPLSGARVTDTLPGPQGCDTADGRLVRAAGLRIAGLGGSIRYKHGPNQYTQGEMRGRALWLEARARLSRISPMRSCRASVGLPFGGTGLRRGVDLLLTHAPPLGLGDGEDPAHQGFAAFHRLVTRLRPRLLLHGHVHPVHRRAPDRTIGATLVVNAIPYRLLELPLTPGG